MAIVEFVKTIRKLSGDSQYSLAPRIGITVTGVQEMEKDGKRRMDLGTLCKLRKVSGLTWPQFGKLLEDEFLPKEKD